MELLTMLGLDASSIKWLFVIIGSCGVMEYLKIYGGRFHEYKDPSGITIIKDRETNKKYMKVGNSTPVELDEKKSN